MEPIKKIVIVGGGTAGWMAASLLGRTLGKYVSITLVESEDIGVVGVGEATVPPIRLFNSLLGINENDFIRATKGTFKLGIQFENWGELGTRYFHPFGKYGDQFGVAPFYQYWLRMYQEGHVGPIDDFSLCSVAAQSGKFNRPHSQDSRSIWSTFSYAFHFDAALYAQFLRGFSESLGVVRLEGKVQKTTLNPTNGFIESVSLENGREISGDLFIDCTGFRGLLIEKALHTGYVNWGHWLPCDRAVAVPCASVSALYPFTRATALDSGWQWRIPLQHRIGNGMVYSSSYLSDEEAANTLLKNIESAPLNDPKFIQFATGRRRKFWNKNVVAVGLSGGFLEPLESTSIHLIQSALTRLVTWFPDKSFNQRNIDEYNRLHIQEMERVRDFIILHYYATQRNDSSFWRYCKDMTIPDELERKIKIFKTHGRLLEFTGDFFEEPSWLAVLLGQNVMPESYDPVANFYKGEDLKNIMIKMKEIISKTAREMPTQESYIGQHFST